MKEEILSRLSPAYPWKEHFHYFDELGSTNDLLKTMAKEGAPHGTVIIADHQTGGHGRMGRSFHSPGGVGVYLSILLRPNCAPVELLHLTCAVAVAMCDAMEAAVGLRPGIKWTNDLVYNKRKLGGILTELGLTPTGMVDYAIIGIGINCCQNLSDFAPDIQHIAGSLAMVTGKEIDRASVAAAMMDALLRMDKTLLSRKQAMLGQYRADCITVGQDISLLRGDEVRHGHAEDVDEAGALVVRFPDGHTEAVNSGEVSVRGMYGYL
ncbi:MAG: biotin--[acetyl-CoA-carboxylase] ligase [Oscillospiraceae bacterium]|nr:biotin--[acetyl-CoA-carboxylase] ligase [Oscillospiraceae bacterium]